MTQRYVVMDNVEHRCCYDSCVRDTSKPTQYSNKFALVCECYEEQTAKMIADALNMQAEQALEVNNATH